MGLLVISGLTLVPNCVYLHPITVNQFQFESLEAGYPPA